MVTVWSSCEQIGCLLPEADVKDRDRTKLSLTFVHPERPRIAEQTEIVVVSTLRSEVSPRTRRHPSTGLRQVVD
jgi:hypothetical protein